MPNFISVKTSVSNKITEKVIESAKSHWLKLEIKDKHAKIAQLELQNYGLHLKLAKNCTNAIEFDSFLHKVHTTTEAAIANKKKSTNKKLRKLKTHNTKERIPRPRPPPDSHFVQNESNETFSSAELSLLAKGLKFCLPPEGQPQEQIETTVAHIEAAISNLDENLKDYVRNACLIKLNKNKEKVHYSESASEYMKIVKNLRNKPCYYLKADKGNKVVILGKDDYNKRVEDLLKTGPYTSIPKTPLNKMVTKIANTLKTCKTIDAFQKRNFHVSNPSVPKLYCLPKIHKEGQQVRPIVSGNDSPTENISSYLVKEFSQLHYPSYSVKNTFNLLEKIQNLQLSDSEILVSFDVSSLFPSVPIKLALRYLETTLIDNNIDRDKISDLLKLTELCMDQNYFQFNDSFFKQTDGTTMGNSLSPFLADLYMSYFETELKQSLPYFPKTWHRYVDDIFCIFDTNEYSLDTFLNHLNSKHPNIKFTVETEKNRKLPFLDILVTRTPQNTLDFDIYRKPTNNDRLIPADSSHPTSHKYAAFNSMIHRALKYPLSLENRKKELKTIKSIAALNGYPVSLVDKLENKIQFKIDFANATTFRPDTPPKKYARMPYNPTLNKGLNNLFKTVGITLAHSNPSNLRSLLGNPKSKDNTLHKSGIYEIDCADCDKLYIGQTKRRLITRFKEHIAHFKFNRRGRSSVADHIFDTGHRIFLDNAKLIKPVNNPSLLSPYESIKLAHVAENRKMNSDGGPLSDSFLIQTLCHP